VRNETISIVVGQRVMVNYYLLLLFPQRSQIYTVVLSYYAPKQSFAGKLNLFLSCKIKRDIRVKDCFSFIFSKH